MSRLAALMIVSLTASTQGYAPSAPIQWMSRVVMPKNFAGPFKYSASPQQLLIKDPPNKMSRDSLPYFTLQSDGSISLEGTESCIEAASAKGGDAVRLNRCSGEPAQKWTWIPDSHGGSRVQLMDTDKCLDASIEGGFDGAPVVLWECESKGAEAWKFEEPAPLQKQGWYMVMNLITLAGVAALSLGALLWQYTGPHKLVPVPLGGTSNVDGGGISLSSPRTVQVTASPREPEPPQMDSNVHHFDPLNLAQGHSDQAMMRRANIDHGRTVMASFVTKQNVNSEVMAPTYIEQSHRIASVVASAMAATIALTPTLAGRRAPAPVMQFWKKGNDSGDRKKKGGSRYNRKDYKAEKWAEESKRFNYYLTAEEEAKRKGYQSEEEAAGYYDGKDLASEGFALYAVFIPFVLFAVAYSNQIFNFGYANGNF